MTYQLKLFIESFIYFTLYAVLFFNNMELPNVVLLHILEYLRGDLTYRRRCVHATTRGKICLKRPIKNSILCTCHEQIFQQQCANHIVKVVRYSAKILD